MRDPGRLTIRRLEAPDVHAVLEVISGCRREYGLHYRVASVLEPSDFDLYETYRQRRSAYFVAIDQTGVIGGAGIGRLEGDTSTCELQRMYLRPEVRRIGIGHALLTRCLETARELQYARCYAETVSEMTAAIALYERHGFRRLKARIGQTGHGHNDCWMRLELQPSAQKTPMGF